MGLSVRAVTVTSAVIWGGCMLFVGLVNLADASYGGEFLRMMSSIYPGADTTRTFGRVLLGALYGVIDGFAGGYFIAILYRFFAREPRSAH